MQDITKIETAIDTYHSELIETKSAMQKAMLMARTIHGLREALTPDIMKGITYLAGSSLGFKTDKDRSGGYHVDVIRDCFIASLIRGLEPCGNQWNIIAGNFYCTKEGYTYLLNKMPALTYSCICSVPDETVPSVGKPWAIVKVKLRWGYKDLGQHEQLEFNCIGAKGKDGSSVTSSDAYIGKAERKAKHWLYHRLSGVNLPEGDVADAIDVEGHEIKKENSKSKLKAVDKPIEEKKTERSDSDEHIKTDLNSYRVVKQQIGTADVDSYIEMRGVDPEKDRPFLAQVLKNPDQFKEAVKKYKEVCSEATK